jgi:hypothetical protein
MNDEHEGSKKLPAMVLTYDAGWRLTAISEGGKTGITTHTYSRREPEVIVEHDLEKRVFRLTGPDGSPQFFRDRATRYLVVEPDPKTGELLPVIREGSPYILCLCHQEHDLK